MDLADDKKLDKFLGQVDKINELIQNLNSENDEERDKAMSEADQFLQVAVKKPAPDRTGVNRTVINKNAYNTPPQGPPSQGPPPACTEQDAFMKALEKDAEERAERKRAGRAKASVFKEEGNEAFKSGDYEQAVKLYTQGLDVIKDFKELWTNRAQAYIKLGRYKEAISDCDWGQRCDETFLKAYVLEAKAHLGLHDYESAINLYKKAMEIDGTKAKMMKEFIREAELARDSAGEERDVRELFESGAQHPATLVDVMKKVKSEGELPLYYDGGVRVLADLLKDDKCKTLFRAEGGLEIYIQHSFFSRVMLEVSLESLNREELDACSGMFHLLTCSAENNDESQKQLLCQPSFPVMVMRFLDHKVLRKKKQLKLSCLSLLLKLSEGEIGRKYICTQFSITELLQALFNLVAYSDTIAVQSMNVVNNMALDGRFRKVLYDNLDTVLSSFVKLLIRTIMLNEIIEPVVHLFSWNLLFFIRYLVKLPPVKSFQSHPLLYVFSPGKSNDCHTLVSDKHAEVIPSCVTIMTNLCTDDRIRRAMSSRDDMICACVEYLNKYPASCLAQCPAYHKAVHAALGLLMNLTLDKTQAVRSAALSIANVILPFLDKQTDIQERVTGCLSHLLPLSPEVTKHFLESDCRVDILLGLIATGQHTKYSVKCLTACTQLSKSTCGKVAANKQVVQSLISLLSTKDEVLLGNVCLCLSHCVEHKEVNELLGIEDMKRLLVVVREANSSVVKQNSAILIGKLVKSNPRHLEALRELDGIGILHNSTKYYKL